MFKKIIFIIIFILSPIISLIGLTPLTMIPSIILSLIINREECLNRTSSMRLCGLDDMFLYIFIFNVFGGLMLTLLAFLNINNHWKIDKKIIYSILLSLYFFSITSVFTYYFIVIPGYFQ